MQKHKRDDVVQTRTALLEGSLDASGIWVSLQSQYKVKSLEVQTVWM